MTRTTVEDIKRWIDNRPEGCHHMIVACDTFNYEDYPVYLTGDDDVEERERELNNENQMSRVMEIYSFTGRYTIEEQLNPRVHVHNRD